MTGPGTYPTHKRKSPPPAAVAAILLCLCALVFVCCVGALSLAVDPDAASPTRTATPSASQAAGKARVTPSPAAKPKPTVYGKLTARAWLKIAKDPDAAAGRAVIVHGEVTQFDSATGTNTFRANVDGVRHERAFDYPTNTILSGAGADLRDVVEGDQFTARVRVLGGYTYETQLGGVTTVPELMVDKIERR